MAEIARQSLYFSEMEMEKGEFRRRPAKSFRRVSETAMLMGLIDQMLESTARASAAIDDALEFIDASNKRIDALDARRSEN